MARFGNSSVSSLISAANAAYSRAQTYNDQAASFEFDMSAKNPEDYAKYKSYLDGRVKAVTNSDPTKALSLTRTAVTANRSFNSAEINRATTSVKFGNSSSRDKYATLASLQQAAVANGDDNLAQSLWGQMASLSVQIQNEDTAAQNAATAGSAKAQTAVKAGIDHTLNTYDQAAKLASAAVKSGKMTVQDYEAGMAKYYAAKDQLLQEAAAGQHGEISQDAVNSYDSAHTTLSSSDNFTKAMAQFPQAQAGISSQYLHVDPAQQNPDGSMAGSLKDRPAGITQEVTGPDGKINYVNAYAGGWQGIEDQTKRTDAIKAGNKDYIFSQVGRDANGKKTTPTNTVGGAPILDAKGNPYVVDQNGVKHYITTDPNSILQRSTEPIQSEADLAKQFGPTTTGGQILSGFTKPLTDFGNSIKTGGLGTGGGIIGLSARLLDRLTGGNNQAVKARQDAITLAAAQKQAEANKIADANKLAQQARLLPVFQPPKPAPLPINKSTPVQYRPISSQLPALVPLGNTGLKVPASTGNVQKDINNAVASLAGFY